MDLIKRVQAKIIQKIINWFANHGLVSIEEFKEEQGLTIKHEQMEFFLKRLEKIEREQLEIRRINEMVGRLQKGLRT